MGRGGLGEGVSVLRSRLASSANWPGRQPRVTGRYLPLSSQAARHGSWPGRYLAMWSWHTEVWDIVAPIYEDVKRRDPLDKEKRAAANEELKSTGRALALPFNISWLNPVATAIPKDEFSVPRAADAGKYHFFKAGEPLAPDQWPLGKAITIGVLQKKLPDARTTGPQDYIQLQNGHIIAGFWWAYAQALRAVASKGGSQAPRAARLAVDSFKNLLLKCVVDVVHVSNSVRLTELAFQFVEDNEELRKIWVSPDSGRCS